MLRSPATHSGNNHGKPWRRQPLHSPGVCRVHPVLGQQERGRRAHRGGRQNRHRNAEQREPRGQHRTRRRLLLLPKQELEFSLELHCLSRRRDGHGVGGEIIGPAMTPLALPEVSTWTACRAGTEVLPQEAWPWTPGQIRSPEQPNSPYPEWTVQVPADLQSPPPDVTVHRGSTGSPHRPLGHSPGG